MSKNENTPAAEFEVFGVSSKLTTSSMGLDSSSLKAAVADAKGKPVAVATILAAVTDFKTAANKLDPSRTDVKFIGTFEGTNLLTGETFRSAAMYLPSAASDYLQGVAQNAGDTAVAFQLTVQADTRPNSAQGYKFGVQAIGEKSSFDPFAALRNQTKQLAKK